MSDGPTTIPAEPTADVGHDALIEAVATWLEQAARAGRLAERVQLADQLRDGTWHTMPTRRTAPGDVDLFRARRAQLLGQPLTRIARAALTRAEDRRVGRAETSATLAEQLGGWS